MGETVSIDIGRALRLQQACLGAAVDVERRADLLVVDLREAGEDPTLLAPALAVSEWAAQATVRVAAVIAAVASWTRPTAGSCPVWLSPAGLVADAPTAISAALDALAALRTADHSTLVRLLRDWIGNADFEVALGARLEVDDLVPWLMMGSGTDAPVVGVGTDDATIIEIVGMLADALSSAVEVGQAPFSLRELLDGGAADGLAPIDAAVLFAAPGAEQRSWSTAWLAAALSLVVVPLTAEARSGDLWAVTRRWGDRRVDLRSSILDALARDRGAAQVALTLVDLGELVGRSANYLDGGAAIAGALAAATRPGELGSLGPGLVMERFVEALSRQDPPSPALTDRMGEIAWPWIGAFRVDRADHRPGGVPNPLPRPSEHRLERYLELASVSVRATADLLDGLDAWFAYQLVRSGSSVPVTNMLYDLGSVARFVSEVGRDAARSAAARADRDRRRDQRLLDLAGNGLGALAGRWWGGAGDFLISSVLVPHVVAPAVVPDLDAELEHLAAVPGVIADDLELREWQVLAHLWRRRETSGLFDSLPPPPSGTLDAHGQLVVPSMLDDVVRDRYRSWRDVVAGSTGIDEVSAAFSRDVPPTGGDGGGGR